MDNIKDLLDAAQSGDNFSNSRFDMFLKENGFTESDTTQRVFLDELFLFYSCWHFVRYKEVPEKRGYHGNSQMYLKYKVRKWKIDYHSWGLRCSQSFFDALERFKPRSEQWQKKLKSVSNGKKSHAQKRVNRRESRQLEKVLNLLHCKNDSSQK